MAKTKLPDPLTRRHLLERELDPALARQIADAYIEADRGVEALPFQVKAGDAEGLASLRKRAVEEGDAFLFRSICSASGEDPCAQEWRELVRAAEALGKLRYAEMAKRQLQTGEE